MSEGTATVEATPDPPTPVEPPAVVDHEAEAAKWKELARKHEDRAKGNAAAAKELEAFKAQSMTEQEKAVATAREEGRTETMRTLAGRLVDAEVRVAANGRTVDVDALLEGLDRTRFISDDGEPKADEIRAWVERVAPTVVEDPPKAGRLDLGQGARGGAIPLNGDPIEHLIRQKLGIE